MKNNNEEIKYDAFGHVRLDEINPGQWYAKFFKNKLNCHKVLVQKSGYFSRSSSPNREDLDLIYKCSIKAVESALNGINCVVGHSIKTDNIESIDFSDIKGGKKFDISQEWFIKLLKEINQN